MFSSRRWVQLIAGIAGMIAVASFQYSWTLFVLPVQLQYGWKEVHIQNALYLFFVPAQTWLVPLDGYLAERFGPRKILVLGGLLATLGWLTNAYATVLEGLYLGQFLTGCGAGMVYSISMGNILKWFPDRRGLAAGLTAAAYGAGAAITVRPIRWTIQSDGYEQAFLWFGAGQGLLIIVAALVVRFPKSGEVSNPTQSRVLQTVRDYTPREILRSPAFWLLYFMMIMGAVPGLVMLGYIAPMARDFGVAEMPVELFWIGSAALPLAMELNSLMGGITRPVFGLLSDFIGREIALLLAFAIEGGALFLLIEFADKPLMFVLMSGLGFFGWGAVFSLFPAVSGDMFGRKFATTNYSLLYTAKGVASLLAAYLSRTHTGDWNFVFTAMIMCDWVAAILAMFVLRPLRARLANAETEKRKN